MIKLHKSKFKWPAYILSCLILNKLYNILYQKWNNYPPGKYGLPFIGNLSVLYKAGKSKYTIADAKYYKTVSMTFFGGLPLITIYNLDIAKQMFVKDTETRKVLSTKFQPLEDTGYQAFGEINGYEWKYRRQITHKSLTILIDSKYIDSRMHQLISNTLYPILDEYSHTKKEYYFRKDLKYTMYQFLFVAFFGNGVDVPQKDEFEKYLKLNDAFWGAFVGQMLVGLFIGPNNFLGRYLNSKIRGGKNPRKDIYDMFEKYGKLYKENIKTSDNIEDCYLKRILEQQKSHNNFDDKKLINDVWGMFSTGFHVTLGIYILRILYIFDVQYIVRLICFCVYR